MLEPNGGIILGRSSTSRSPPLREAIRGLFDPYLDDETAVNRVLPLGRKRWQVESQNTWVRMPRWVPHTVIFAPTGAGKNVSIASPFLLTCPDSCVVVDYKGELARDLAEFRRRRFGHRVVLLDPWRLCTDQPDMLNPLDFFDGQDPEVLQEALDLAEALVIRTGKEHDPHWADSAEVLLTALIVAVAFFAPEAERNLQSVRERLIDPEKFQSAIQALCASDALGGRLRRFGHQMMAYRDKELGSVLTTANRSLRFLDSPAVGESMRVSSFDPAEIRERTTAFLILPPTHQRTQSPLMRCWLTCLIRAVVKGGLQEKNFVHFVLDESSSLGRMDILIDAVEKFRGYGLKLQFYLQSLGQLRQHYPDGLDLTILSNTAQIFFGINEPTTADFVSSRLGDATIWVESQGDGEGNGVSSGRGGVEGRNRTFNTSRNFNQQSRRLARPDELMRWSNRMAVTFVPGLPPIKTRLLRSYEELELYEPRPPRKYAKWPLVAQSLATLIASIVMVAFVVDVLTDNQPRTYRTRTMMPTEAKKAALPNQKTGQALKGGNTSRPVSPKSSKR